MKLSFSELKIIKKSLDYQAMASYSEKETIEMLLTSNKIVSEMTKRERCFNCENKFSEIEKQTINSRPNWICVACFTSNS